MRDVNKKYKGKYTNVRLSSDIHSGLDIIRSGSDIQCLLNQYQFGYFAILARISVRIFHVGFRYGFGYRIKCPPLNVHIAHLTILFANLVIIQPNWYWPDILFWVCALFEVVVVSPYTVLLVDVLTPHQPISFWLSKFNVCF